MQRQTYYLVFKTKLKTEKLSSSYKKSKSYRGKFYISVFCITPAHDGGDDDDGLDICLETRLLGHYIIESMVYCSHLPYLVNASWL